MTCPSTYTYINGLCYSPCISGWEPNSEDTTTCVEIGCPSFTTRSSINASILTTCLYNSIYFTNEYCQKRLTNDAACGCNNLYSDTGTGACQKFSKARATLWPKCSIFEHYDGHECTFNSSYFIFVIITLLVFFILFYVFMKHFFSGNQQIELPEIKTSFSGRTVPTFTGIGLAPPHPVNVGPTIPT